MAVFPLYPTTPSRSLSNTNTRIMRRAKSETPSFSCLSYAASFRTCVGCEPGPLRQGHCCVPSVWHAATLLLLLAACPAILETLPLFTLLPYDPTLSPEVFSEDRQTLTLTVRSRSGWIRVPKGQGEVCLRRK